MFSGTTTGHTEDSNGEHSTNLEYTDIDDIENILFELWCTTHGTNLTFIITVFSNL